MLAGPASPGHASNNSGADPLSFLFLDANARSVGMGGAYTALAYDANALLYNPAGLGMVSRHEATFMHNQFFEGISHEYLGLALRQGLGFNLNYIRYPRTARTTYDVTDGSLGSFGGHDLSAAAGYGHSLAEGLSVGASFKYIRQAIDNQYANAYAFDLGFLARAEGLSLGLAVQNMGPDARFQKARFRGAREHLPLNIRGGAGYAFQWLGLDHVLAIDAAKERSEDAVMGIGFESVIAKTLALRVGYNSRNSSDIGLSGGIGWKISRDLSVDYAVAPFGALGFTHRASATARWGSSTGGDGPVEKERRASPAPEPVQVPDVSQTSAAETTPARESKPAPPLSLADMHLDTAEQEIEARRFKKAEFALENALKLMGPNDLRRVHYFTLLGGIAFLKGEIAPAKAYYKEAIRNASVLGFGGPSLAAAYAGLGQCLAEEKNVPAAIEVLEKALGAAPSPAMRGLIESKLKELKEARNL